MSWRSCSLQQHLHGEGVFTSIKQIMNVEMKPGEHHICHIIHQNFIELLSLFQVETDSWIENASNGLMGMQIVKPNGQLKFVVNLLLGCRFSMTGTYS
nr:probable plastid-lipid-associated protein 12, chloroplastic [Ipomoea batatas]